MQNVTDADHSKTTNLWESTHTKEASGPLTLLALSTLSPMGTKCTVTPAKANMPVTLCHAKKV